MPFLSNYNRIKSLRNGLKSFFPRHGDAEDAHVHKIATEFTVVTQGVVEMNGVRYVSGDIIVIEPGEATNFRAITDAVTTVVKIPGAPDDKYTA